MSKRVVDQKKNQMSNRRRVSAERENRPAGLRVDRKMR
jgi:hypothetical protein